ncbi:MAG: folate-binding protein YgfZ [bacterium]|nr:folate-binding protein YgfZ [bacterium]
MSESVSDYELLRTKAAAILGRSGLVWVVGPDAVSFLDALLSQNITAMEPGTTSRSLLLAPNGKLRATMLVLRGEDRVGLVCDASATAVVVADLTRFKIRVDVEIRAEERPVWDVWGPDATVLLSVPDVGSWDEMVLTVQYPFRFSTLPRIVLVGDAPPLPVVDPGAAEVIRIEVGEPTMGVDLDERTIPQEGVDVAATVDFGKGCYLGQELVARIDSRGHVNRRLCGIRVAGEQAIAAGAEIAHEGRSVGTLTSVGYSAAMGSVIGLALVRVEVVAEAEVSVGGLVGSVVGLPLKA